MNNHKGAALIPLLLLGALVVFAGGLYTFTKLFPDAPASRVVRSIEDNASVREGAELVLTDDVLWSGSRLDLFAGYVPEDDIVTQRIAVGPTSAKTLEFSVKSDTKVKASLVSPKSAAITTPAKTVANSDGTVTLLFSVPTTADTAGVWTLSLNNTGATSAAYHISIPDTAPISVSDTTGSYFNAAQSITISIVVEETTSTLAVQAVTGATVVATVTSPSGIVTTITLTEDPNHPGTYTGVLTGATEPGTYTIVYTITGTNSEGVAFNQTTTSQFALSPEGTVTGVSTWVKKFDINRGNELQLIGY